MTLEEQNKELSSEELEKAEGGMETGSELREQCVRCGRYYPLSQLLQGICINCLRDMP